MSRRKKIDGLARAFGRAVRSLRTKARLSQEEFAHKCEMDRAYYGNIERGEHVPTVATLWRIADVLSKRPRDVIAKVESELQGAKLKVHPAVPGKTEGKQKP